MPLAQAEFSLNSWGGLDYYDLVHTYFTVPMLLQPSDRSCAAAGCQSDLNLHCESAPTDGRLLSAGGTQACHRLPLVLNACADPGASSSSAAAGCRSAA
jgi:hypothetical protein